MKPTPYTTDTSAEANEFQLAGIRAMSPQERVARGCAMSVRARRQALAAIGRTHPDLDDAGVRSMFLELAYGRDLADAIRRWQAERAP